MAGVHTRFILVVCNRDARKALTTSDVDVYWDENKCHVAGLAFLIVLNRQGVVRCL